MCKKVDLAGLERLPMYVSTLVVSKYILNKLKWECVEERYLFLGFLKLSLKDFRANQFLYTYLSSQCELIYD